MWKINKIWLGISSLLVLLTGLVACGDITAGPDSNPVQPLPTVTAGVSGITPIVPPSQSLTGPTTVPATPLAPTTTNPPTNTNTQPSAAQPALACGNQPGREIEGIAENSSPGLITIDKQMYRYDPTLLAKNGKIPQAGSKVHLSLRCSNGQLVVIKLMTQGGDKSKDNSDNNND